MWKIAGVVILGMIMSILDTTIVNVALRTLGHDLHSSLAQIQWVITGYLLSLAAVIPITGWAARRFGAKRVYMTSLVLFTVGSALCAIATSTTELVLFRVLQGAGGGMIMPVAQLIMAQVAGPKRMGRVMGIVAMPAMLGPILGPVRRRHDPARACTGRGSSSSTCRSASSPSSSAGGSSRTPNRARRAAWTCSGWRCSRPRRQRVVYGLAQLGTPHDLLASAVVVPILAGLVLTAVFCWHALRVERPLLDIRLYTNRIFAAASFTTFALGAALFGAMILVPLYYQEVRHESLIATGLLVGPQGLGMLVAMPIAGRLTDRFGGGRVALVGVSVLCLSTIPFAFIGASTSIVAISAVLLVRGVGIGFSFMPAMTTAFASLRPDQLSDATPQLNVLQRIGGAIGTAVLAVVLQRASGHAPSTAHLAHAFNIAYWWSFGTAALGLIPCIVLLRAENPRARLSRAAANAEAAVEPLGA